VIPVLNAEKTIKKCLESIFMQEYSTAAFEVIVVDNGSKDASLELLKKFYVKILIDKTATISKLRNIGARNGQGNILAFVDSDCIVSKRWLEKALTYFEDEAVGIVGSHYKIPENCNWVGKAWDAISAKRGVKGEVDQLPGGNMFIAKKCFEEIGGFNETLITNEDVDICYRASKAGYRVYSDPNISVIHLGDCISLWKLFNKEIWRGQEVFRLFLKDKRKVNFKASAFAFFFLISLMLTIIGGILLLVNGNGQVMAVAVGIFIGMPLILSIHTAWRNNNGREIINVCLIYIIFGMARALALIKNIIKMAFNNR
jgi:glycosyltransferase involved in cell wall biosynthesis